MVSSYQRVEDGVNTVSFFFSDEEEKELKEKFMRIFDSILKGKEHNLLTDSEYFINFMVFYKENNPTDIQVQDWILNEHSFNYPPSSLETTSLVQSNSKEQEPEIGFSFPDVDPFDDDDETKGIDKEDKWKFDKELSNIAIAGILLGTLSYFIYKELF